jgi:hypothetical protein
MGKYFLDRLVTTILIGGVDVILLVQWLRALGTITTNYHKLFMRIFVEGKCSMGVKVRHHTTMRRKKRVESPFGFKARLRNLRREEDGKEREGDNDTMLIRVDYVTQDCRLIRVIQLGLNNK